MGTNWEDQMFECLIRSITKCLKNILLCSVTQYEGMITVLAQIQCIFNNYPSAHIYGNIDDCPFAPNHLLFGPCLTLSSRRYGELNSDV